MARRKRSKRPKAEHHRHPEADSPMRPEVGTQAQFRKKKEPATYPYDSSLAPEMNCDGQNPARELGVRSPSPMELVAGPAERSGRY